ncbi:hypothetical protein N7530_004570 [Penicillium desertorum]|uniref:Zn(2)-C6 fungal-type domain-containing protein n=1 Tax=Penicillium desertorum TaxID=1303715 RepID=A0A9X0BR11_9EURO|nr:hypothetical protein N7530_004570 [Penicillium desertorum]
MCTHAPTNRYKGYDIRNVTKTHPACLRCTSAGKECGGYKKPVDKRTREWRDSNARGSANNQNNVALQIRYRSKARPSVTAVPLPLSSACRIDLDWNGRWYLDFYHNRTAVRFSHYFQNSFWHGLVFQMCENYPAVRHAMIAISAWHTQLERIPKSHKEDRDPRLTLHHSAKAIACLRESLSSHGLTRTHRQVVLVTCLIFTVLALFQGDLYSARTHLTSGYKLFKEWDVQDDKGATGLALEQAFVQMHVHWFFCSHSELFVEDAEPLHGEYQISPNTTGALSKITPHIYSGIDQMDRVQEFATLVSGLVLDRTTYGFDIGPASSTGRDAAAVSTKLRFCRSRLTASLIELDSLAPGDCDSLKFLSLWIDIIEIKLAVAKSQKPDEMAYDDHLEQFQNITRLVQFLAGPGSGSSDIESSPFNHRFSILPALLWSAAKCRDWQVRRDLCSIMHSRPGDGYWLCATTVALKRLIDVESTGVKPGDIIPKAARAYLVNVNIRTDESKVKLRYRRPQYVSHSKHGGDEWEGETMNY